MTGVPDVPPTVILAVFSTGLYKFNLTLGSAGNYYFIFENQENIRSTVIFQLNIVNDVVIVNPCCRIPAHFALLVGILLLALGVTGREERSRRPDRSQELSGGIAVPTAQFCNVCNLVATTGWRCGFCGTGNPLEEKFCKDCGRSQQ